jgi:hypothetical protein
LKKLTLILIVLMLFAAKVNADDIIKPSGLPTLGKLMIGPDNKPANWIGIKYKGKRLWEPINIIIVDRKAKDLEDSKARIKKYMRSAGFMDRGGHSSGYKAYIAGKMESQLPPEKDHAYSDGWYVFDNDHCRLFGPYFDGKRYIFTASFSREIVGIYNGKLTHKYGSFNKARDAFSKKVMARTDMKYKKVVNMWNKIDIKTTTTGDHDGKAFLISN